MRSDPHRRELAAYPFQLELGLRFGDLDPNWHLNNVATARLYEEARVRFHVAQREAMPEVSSAHVVVAHVAIDYLGEGGWPKPVTVGVGVAGVGGSSYRLGLALFQDGACIGLCDTVLVHRSDGGSAPLPQALRDTLEGLRLKA